MKKKKAARAGFQASVRLTDAEYQAFLRAAEAEGFSTIPAWMMEQARVRGSKQEIDLFATRILLVALCCTPEEIRDQVLHIPL